MPRTVVVTGGAGTLGRHAVEALEEQGVEVRVLTRRDRPAEAPAGRGWFRADLLTDALGPALQDADAVLHLASAKGPGDADVVATSRLLTAARGVRHFVFVSIIGCDRIPLPFYASKTRVETLVRTSGAAWSIVRVAQFHSFVERLVRTAASVPVPAPIVADLKFQPVDEREVADLLVAIALGEPLGDAPEIAGPEVLSLGEIAEIWLQATRSPRTLLAVSLEAAAPPPPGAEPWARPVLEGYRSAWNTPQGQRTLGKVRFADWMRNWRKTTK
jgi:uncharacterized protein YbjT (DUF2867 family)